MFKQHTFAEYDDTDTHADWLHALLNSVAKDMEGRNLCLCVITEYAACMASARRQGHTCNTLSNDAEAQVVSFHILYSRWLCHQECTYIHIYTSFLLIFTDDKYKEKGYMCMYVCTLWMAKPSAVKDMEGTTQAWVALQTQLVLSASHHNTV